MTPREPDTVLLDQRYGTATEPTPWSRAVEAIEAGDLFWCTTVRSDGRPHSVPLHTVWMDDALHFCTGAREQKAVNLQDNPHVSLLTGSNQLGSLQVAVEGVAERVQDRPVLQRLADAWKSRHGEFWDFQPADGGFTSEGDGRIALVFRVAPRTVYAFATGSEPSQTRYTFAS